MSAEDLEAETILDTLIREGQQFLEDPRTSSSSSAIPSSSSSAVPAGHVYVEPTAKLVAPAPSAVADSYLPPTPKSEMAPTTPKVNPPPPPVPPKVPSVMPSPWKSPPPKPRPILPPMASTVGARAKVAPPPETPPKQRVLVPDVAYVFCF